MRKAYVHQLYIALQPCMCNKLEKCQIPLPKGLKNIGFPTSNITVVPSVSNLIVLGTSSWPRDTQGKTVILSRGWKLICQCYSQLDCFPLKHSTAQVIASALTALISPTSHIYRKSCRNICAKGYLLLIKFNLALCHTYTLF